ncbi:MAG: bifunctional methylenetetrahydrofolate dehydrogenase/methenyltetrahydrofolate cyclohydrolase FolD [Proteobacteria bacterium]|nr:bifunctional methylenetetrahydrofolate dehydrogenase/methenyltetrahydrofolate cyclohydrolase FolD [Pseudomonadota bacterium]
MTARIIDGKAVARHLRAEYASRVERLKSQHGVQPGIAVILVGDNPASQVYVRNKIRACQETGIHSELHQMSADTPETELLARIDSLNADPKVHGILVQLPLPPHIVVPHVLERIAVEKDVDGFHLYNVGGLVTGNTVFPPCTPYGVQKLLEYEKVEIAGRNVVVVGASNIVGKPMALMLMQQDATVCICHKLTRDLGQFTMLADILVVAAGVPELIVPQMVKTGVVVIDVGINRLPDGRLVGDVDFEGVRKKASLISPVPGGVGPMTITMLLHNTLISAERSLGITPKDAPTA